MARLISGISTSPEVDLARLKQEGFGPEAHSDDQDPTAQTRMVT